MYVCTCIFIASLLSHGGGYRGVLSLSLFSSPISAPFSVSLIPLHFLPPPVLSPVYPPLPPGSSRKLHLFFFCYMHSQATRNLLKHCWIFVRQTEFFAGQILSDRKNIWRRFTMYQQILIINLQKTLVLMYSDSRRK